MLILSTFDKLQTALLGLLASFTAPGDEDPPALVDAPEVTAADLQDVYIEDIQSSGPGCPSGTVASAIASNRQSFLVSYSRMILENPHPAGKTVQFTNCVSAIRLHVPRGVQVSVATVNARGYAYLDPGIRGRQTSKYFFAGAPASIGSHHKLVGRFDGHFDFSDRFPFGTQAWSNCGESILFVIDSQLQLDAKSNPAGDALFNTIDTDGRFNMRYHLRWKRC